MALGTQEHHDDRCESDSALEDRMSDIRAAAYEGATELVRKLGQQFPGQIDANQDARDGCAEWIVESVMEIAS